MLETGSFVLSMANTYRTILALPFFLLALGYGRREVIKCIISFIIAVLIHNGYFILLPVLLLLFKGQFRYFIPIVTATFAILLLTYIDLDFIYAMAERDLSSSIGRNIHIYLLLCLMFIISVTIFSENLIINKNNITLFKILGISFVIYLGCFSFMGNQPLQRLFMLLVSILFPLGGFYMEHKFKSKSEGRVLYCHLALIPWIYYGS